MDQYLHEMVQQATIIAESEQTEARAHAASLLLQDIVFEMEGVSRAAQQADAAGAPATCDDGHASADAAIASIQAAVARGPPETASRHAIVPSAGSASSPCSAGSGAVNGSTSKAVGMTPSLTITDPDVPDSRSADRSYLSKITQSKGAVRPILSHSILPYETYWMHARGV